MCSSRCTRRRCSRCLGRLDVGQLLDAESTMLRASCARRSPSRWPVTTTITVTTPGPMAVKITARAAGPGTRAACRRASMIRGPEPAADVAGDQAEHDPHGPASATTATPISSEIAAPIDQPRRACRGRGSRCRAGGSSVPPTIRRRLQAVEERLARSATPTGSARARTPPRPRSTGTAGRPEDARPCPCLSVAPRTPERRVGLGRVAMPSAGRQSAVMRSPVTELDPRVDERVAECRR